MSTLIESKIVKLEPDTVREIQKISLEIMIAIDKICREHNITYFLHRGTLLGACRHQGFIPWDVDLDILMPRKDYDQFLKIATEALPSQYKLKHYTTTDYYPYVFAKIDDSQTTLIESSTSYIGGVFVDVFPMDGVPEKTYTNIYRQYSYYMRNNFYRTLFLSYFAGNDRKFRFDPLFRTVKRILRKTVNIKKIQKRYESLFYKKEYCDTIHISTFPYGFYHSPYLFFQPPKELPFEGHLFFVPSQQEAVLIQNYSDYTILPPEEQRVPVHRYSFIDLNKSYLEYLDKSNENK